MLCNYIMSANIYLTYEDRTYTLVVKEAYNSPQ